MHPCRFRPSRLLDLYCVTHARYYDFASIVVDLDDGPAIFTFGGDRETFDFEDPTNYLRIEDDVWQFAAQ